MNKMNICGKEVQTDDFYLDLSDENLTSLPAEIGKLKNLMHLDLCFNKLTSLPAEIGKLEKLKSLYLINNAISKEDIEKIKKLLPNCKILNDYE